MRRPDLPADVLECAINGWLTGAAESTKPARFPDWTVDDLARELTEHIREEFPEMSLGLDVEHDAAPADTGTTETEEHDRG